MKLIIFLLFAHFIGDVFLRTKFIDYYKHRSVIVLLFHCFIWAGCISIVLEYFDIFTLGKFVFLISWHFAIDAWKSNYDPKIEWSDGNKVNFNWHKVIDQFVHFLQLICVM